MTWIILTTWCSWTYHIVLNLWSYDLVTWWLWYINSSRVLHAHYIHVIVYIHHLISHDLVFCYSHWYFICQFVLPSNSLFNHSSALLITPFLSHFYIIVSFSCVCTCWSTSDGPWFFSIRARGDWWATIRRNPGRLSDVSPKFLILCILVFCLVMMTRCLFLFCYVSSFVSSQRLS